MHLSFSRYSQTLLVNPEDQYDPAVLGECPDHNRHRTLKAKANWLRDNLYEPDVAVTLLKEWLSRAPRHNEVEDTVRRSWAELNLPSISYELRPHLPSLDQAAVLSLYRQYGGYDELLFERFRMDDSIRDTSTAEWLNLLYNPDDLICIADTKYGTQVRSVYHVCHMLDVILGDKTNSWYKLYQLSHPLYFCLLTPAVYKERQLEIDGGLFGRCDLNIASRRYFVLECDISETKKEWQGLLPNKEYDGFDLQAGVISHLLEIGFPLTCVVHSGNKSLHVWCSGKGFTSEQINELVSATAYLGVDAKAGMIPSQFMRCPNPHHPFRAQPLLYLNQENINRG